MNVVLSPEASRQLERLFAYLESQWSAETRKQFQKKFYRHIDIIKTMPRAFPQSATFPDTRKCVVSKQTSIYYRVTSSGIQIISVWDNRMDKPEE